MNKTEFIIIECNFIILIFRIHFYFGVGFISKCSVNSEFLFNKSDLFYVTS